MTYIAPDIELLSPSEGQRMILEFIVNGIDDAAPTFWAKGRGAGKSTLRAMIAHAILSDDEHPLYKVVPVVYEDRT